MTDDEWMAIRKVLRHTFVQTDGNAYTEAKDDAYRMSLDGYDPAAVLAALLRLQRERTRFLPPVADILEKLGDDPTLPSWPEVLQALARCWTGGRRLARAAGEAEGDAHVVRWLAENVHPWVAAWAEAYGVDALRHAPIAEGEYAGLERDRLRQRWEEWLGRAEERRAAGLPVTVGAIRAQLGPRQFDAVAALGLRPSAGELEAGSPASG